MIAPKFETVATKVLADILVGMLKQEEAPCSAESHLARAAVIIQQFADVSSLDKELLDQLRHCMKITL